MTCKTVDDLGVVQIPKSMRETLGIKAGDKVEFFVNKLGEVIIQVVKE